ncbi:ORF4 [Haliotid herpesvirus 1]|nr:ORF4 [Haliotid herpesvirus 1]
MASSNIELKRFMDKYAAVQGEENKMRQMEAELDECIVMRLKVVDAKMRLAEVKTEGSHEHLLRMEAEAKAMEAEVVCKQTLLEIHERKIEELKAQQETDVALFKKECAELSAEKIKLEKRREANKFNMERIIERMNQDQTNHEKQ